MSVTIAFQWWARRGTAHVYSIAGGRRVAGGGMCARAFDSDLSVATAFTPRCADCERTARIVNAPTTTAPEPTEATK